MPVVEGSPNDRDDALTSPADPVAAILALIERQREEALASAADLSRDELWRRPEPGEWSVGEILEHTRRFNASMAPLFRFAWAFRGLARPFRDKPYPVEIADPYRKPRMPMNVGWVWSPRRAARARPSLDELRAGMLAAHEAVAGFFEGKDPRILGHIRAWDPAIGAPNLIQGLRVLAYHDALHYEDVVSQGAALRAARRPA